VSTASFDRHANHDSRGLDFRRNIIAHSVAVSTQGSRTHGAVGLRLVALDFAVCALSRMIWHRTSHGRRVVLDP